MEDFATFLRSRLQRRGDLARLAEASGVAGPVLIRLRDGVHRPSMETLHRLAPALGVPYEDLLRMSGYLEGEPELSEAVATLPADPRARDILRLWDYLPEHRRAAMHELAALPVQPVPPLRRGVKGRESLRGNAVEGTTNVRTVERCPHGNLPGQCTLANCKHALAGRRRLAAAA